MKIRIIKASTAGLWYRDRIGDVIEVMVVQMHKPVYRVRGWNLFIDPEDCKALSGKWMLCPDTRTKRLDNSSDELDTMSEAELRAKLREMMGRVPCAG